MRHLNTVDYGIKCYFIAIATIKKVVLHLQLENAKELPFIWNESLLIKIVKLERILFT